MAGAQPYVTGPPAIWVGVGTAFAPLFLGTVEGELDQQYSVEYGEMYNSLRGQKPFDYEYYGESVVIGVTVTRYVEAVMQAIESVPFPNGTRGNNPFGSMGTLMIFEGGGYPLWILYPYGPQTVMPGAKAAYNTQEPGRRYLAAWKVGETIKGGTQGKKAFIMFQVEQVFNPTTYGYTLFDNNMSGLPAPS
jgi:hypothetical protein